MTGRRGQALAVALLVLAIATIWFGVISPVLAWYGDRADGLARRSAYLQHMQALEAELPALRAAAARPRARAETTMLSGATDPVAAADLQERLQAMAASAGASLTAVETLPPSDSGGRWHKITLRISLTAPWPVLMQLVSQIEQSPTRILIDDVHFHSAAVVNRPAVLPIQASMVVYGFRQIAAGT